MQVPYQLLVALSLLVLLPYGVHNDQTTDWHEAGQDELSEALRVRPTLTKAKNVIVFLGDGLGVSTITSSRIFNAQKSGQNFWDARLAADKFRHVGMTMTYCSNQLVTDSAAAATAIMTGTKSRSGVIGLNDKVLQGRCDLQKGNELKSVLKYAHEAGKRTGIISTSRITDATPAAAYANSPSRAYETDGAIPDEYRTLCKDIARQMVEDSNYINVLLGGGRAKLMPDTTSDPEYPEERGDRTDGRDLIEEWKRIMRQKFTANDDKYKFVQRMDEFTNVDPTKVERLLGLFEPGFMHYEADRRNSSKNKWPEPSISEMTEMAINILKKGDQGYFLFVEGGRIDHAHHINKAYRALNETLAFSEAVQKAVDMTDDKDTLILVTSDHSHVFTMSGYSSIDSNILGLSTVVNVEEVTIAKAQDGLPYTTLGYTNGPGFYYHINNTDVSGYRRNLTEDGSSGKTVGPDYLQPSSVPLMYETHAGEDVPIYGRGPLSHLVTGTHEISYIAHLIMYASCIGPSQGTRNFCKEKADYAGWPMGPRFADPSPVMSGANGFERASIFLYLLVFLTSVRCNFN